MIQIGQRIYFKRVGDSRRLKGQVIGQDGDCWKVRGTRAAGKFTAPVHTLHTQEIITDHVPERLLPKKRESGHGSCGLSVPVVESIRRMETAAARLGMSETEILQAQAMLEMRWRTLRGLAASNGIVANNSDFEYEELSGEHLVATLTALRSATSKAPDKDLEEFRAFLYGNVSDSRIMMSISRTAKTAAIRYLQRRAKYRLYHVDIHSMERRLAA